MKIYLVGGAVRDRLLGLAVNERDWVVLDANEQQMLDLGYRKVDAPFPVYLHPETKEEYALARVERKQGRGYQGFVWEVGGAVTLEDDLLRRDLTINAMAEDEKGEVVDPWGGRQDLENRLLRHVSPAFAEDPLRVLRVARFAARFAPLGFSVADDTLQLMHSLVGELDALPAERIWRETQRALEYQDASEYFQVLQQCGALEHLAPQLPEHLDELQRRLNILQAVELRATSLMCLDPEARLWSKAPSRYTDLCRSALALQELGRETETPEQKLKFLQQADYRRRPKRFADLLALCQVQTGVSQEVWVQRAERLSVAEQSLLRQSPPEPIADALRQVALEALQEDE